MQENTKKLTSCKHLTLTTCVWDWSSDLDWIERLSMRHEQRHSDKLKAINLMSDHKNALEWDSDNDNDNYDDRGCDQKPQHGD